MNKKRILLTEEFAVVTIELSPDTMVAVLPPEPLKPAAELRAQKRLLRLWKQFRLPGVPLVFPAGTEFVKVSRGQVARRRRPA